MEDGTLVEINPPTDPRKRVQHDDEAIASILSTSLKKRKRDPVLVQPPPNPAHTLQVYCDMPNPTSKPKLSSIPTHTAPQLKISGNGYTVSNNKGYRLCKSTHGVVTGNWYYEVTLPNPSQKSNARIGWSQISGDLQAPCGYDIFSYAWRQRPGTLFHASDAIEVADDFNHGYGLHDVIGVCIELPPLTSEMKEDLESREWDMDENPSYIPYKREPIPSVPDSRIVYYKNGIRVGEAFEGLGLGKYHAAVSVYGEGGAAVVNFGPEFRMRVPEGYRGFCECGGGSGREKDVRVKKGLEGENFVLDVTMTHRESLEKDEAARGAVKEMAPIKTEETDMVEEKAAMMDELVTTTEKTHKPVEETYEEIISVKLEESPINAKHVQEEEFPREREMAGSTPSSKEGSLEIDVEGDAMLTDSVSDIVDVTPEG